MFSLFRREPELSGMVADLAEAVEVDLSTPTAEAAKKRIAPAQEQLDWEIAGLEADILTAEGEVMGLEGQISSLRATIAEKKAGIADRRKFKAIIDKAASDLDALNVEYDPADDAKKSYDLAVQVKRERGDTHWPERASEKAKTRKPKSRRKAEMAAAE